MNKFKKVLLGAMSVLTLGLFVAVSAKVNAADSGNYYFYKNSETRALVYNDSTAGKSNIALSGSTNSGNGARDLTITDSIIPNGAAVASGNYFIKVSKDTNISFTTTDSFVFKMNVFVNSKTGSVTLKNASNETLDTKSVSGGKANVILGTDDALAPGTYTFSGTVELNIYEIYINVQAQEGDGYMISYNYNGHGTNSSSLNQTALPETLPSPSVTGYTFGGWYVDSELTTPAVAGATISANTTLYAKWTVNSSEWCTITFDSNGGSTVASTSQIYGSTYTLPNCTKSGYYLTGWSDGSSTYTSTYTVPSSSTQTLTAQWAECIAFDESCYFTKGDDNNTAAASNAMFTVSGKVNTNSDAPVTYNGQTYNTPLKMESSTTLTFTLANPATIYIAFTSSTGNCNIEGTSYTKAKKAATNGVLVLELDADSYTITKGDTNNIGFIGVIYDKLNKGTTADVFAEKNSTGDTLRFIGGISGINDLDDIATIELILKKDGVATKKQIFLTTCYTSVVGASQPCPASPENGVYYVIYRITGASNLTGTISKQLKVTFTDGSTLLSDVTEIVLA